MRPDDTTVLYKTEPVQEGRTEHSKCLTPLVSPPAMTGRYIKTRADFGGSQFNGDEGRDGPRSVGLLATQPSDLAASPRILLNLDSVKALNYISIILI